MDLTVEEVLERIEFEDYTAVLSGIPTPRVPLGTLALRLTDEERRMLDILLEYGESTAEQVAGYAGLSVPLASGILRDLSRRRYVAEITEPNRVPFHVVLPELQTRRRVHRRIQGSKGMGEE